MNERLSQHLNRGALVLALLFVLYVAGYLAMFYRDESLSYTKTVPEGELSNYQVGACLRGGAVAHWFGHIFTYAHRVDVWYLRRHYWSSYSVTVGPGRTNIVYAIDQIRKSPPTR